MTSLLACDASKNRINKHLRQPMYFFCRELSRFRSSTAEDTFRCLSMLTSSQRLNRHSKGEQQKTAALPENCVTS